MYPKDMEKSIRKVEETREKRLHTLPKPMSAKEREDILKKYHPDYKKEGKRKLTVGINKRMTVPNEVADLIEAHPIVQENDVDLSHIDYDVDVLIIGGGGAGTVAGLWAYYEGIKPEDILIITKLRHGDSNSIMAQGGIQAADKPHDSPAIHFLDAYGGGHFSNKKELVETLVKDAPSIIQWHEELGVMYDKNPEGDMITIHGGGTSRKRMHSAKDYTGLEILRILRDEMRNLGIPIIEFSPAVELLTNGKKVAGALLYNMETEQYYVARAKATVLATGGFGRLHIQDFPTTNHYGATADGLVMAHHAGARLRDMDSVQYHPTGAAYPEQVVGQLITEKVRGLGAQPVNVDGAQFVYPLEPRDVESSAIIRECYGRNKGIKTPTGMRGVWLDSPLIDIIHGDGTVEKNLAAMYRLLKRFDIDMSVEPILVFPTLHYQNGGIEINEQACVLGAQGIIEGLFAGGEVEGGVHGKNRLMGNSLLDYNVFGRRAGIAAAHHAKKAKHGKISLDHLKKYRDMLKEAGVKTKRKSPILLPEYRGKEALSRALDIF